MIKLKVWWEYPGIIQRFSVLGFSWGESFDGYWLMLFIFGVVVEINYLR